MLGENLELEKQSCRKLTQTLIFVDHLHVTHMHVTCCLLVFCYTVYNYMHIFDAPHTYIMC